MAALDDLVRRTAARAGHACNRRFIVFASITDRVRCCLRQVDDPDGIAEPVHIVFEAQATLLSLLCLDRNYIAIGLLQPRWPVQVLLQGIQSTAVPRCVPRRPRTLCLPVSLTELKRAQQLLH